MATKPGLSPEKALWKQERHLHQLSTAAASTTVGVDAALQTAGPDWVHTAVWALPFSKGKHGHVSKKEFWWYGLGLEVSRPGEEGMELRATCLT